MGSVDPWPDNHSGRGGAPYRHLLHPKAGGLAFTVASMGAQLYSLLDVTIVYPGGRPTFWDLVSRGVPSIVVRVREIPIPRDWLTGDYEGDATFRDSVKEFVRRLWEEKDAFVTETLSSSL